MGFSRSSFAHLTVGVDATVADAVARMGAQMIFVLDEAGVLRGMVSNGDFRKFMLAGGSMGDPVTACMNTAFARVGPEASHADFARHFSRGLALVPRVDAAGRLIEVMSWEHQPQEHETHYKILWDRANQQSADYIEPHLDGVLLVMDRADLWDHAVSLASLNGLWVEFGVFHGASINHFAGMRPDKRIYGFDSFEGLKEAWAGQGAGAGTFGLGGELPEVRDNVTLVKGWFDQTLPAFLAEHPGPAAFLHMDADTYPSTAMVFDHIGDRIGPGTVIVFDEYLGYPNWRNGEHRAWRELVERRGLTYRYLGFGPMHAAVQVL